MKYFLILICTLFFLNLQAQDRIQVQGLVKTGDFLLQNVHVKNISSGKFSISDEKGELFLNIQAGDTLLLSHVGMQDLIRYVKNEDLEDFPLTFNMRESSTELREVIVDETSEINAVSLGIIPKKIEKLSMNERRLRTAGDFKPKHLLGIIGGAVSIDAILNAINGRTKKLKRNIAVEKKQRNIAFLEIHHLNYLKKEMELSDQQVQLLISFVIEEEQLEHIIASGNEGQMQLYLLDTWFRLQAQKNSPPN